MTARARPGRDRPRTFHRILSMPRAVGGGAYGGDSGRARDPMTDAARSVIEPCRLSAPAPPPAPAPPKNDDRRPPAAAGLPGANAQAQQARLGRAGGLPQAAHGPAIARTPGQAHDQPR